MATVAPVLIDTAYNGHVDVYEWAAMNDGDTILWLVLPIKADKSVHAYGGFGGTVAIQGSLEDDPPANPVTLTDPAGDALTFTAAGIRSVLQPVVRIRPSPGAGVSNTTVRLLAVRP